MQYADYVADKPRYISIVDDVEYQKITIQVITTMVVLMMIAMIMKK